MESFVSACLELELNESTDDFDIPEGFNAGDAETLAMQINGQMGAGKMISLRVDYANKSIYGVCRKSA